ncbi:MAG: HAD-IA family hydrolase [Pseudomonadales bacterium]|nr:HAD-IA family hydrolase [Pseudomonadales bacterium]
MNQLDAVLFDLDGTLIDTAPDFVRTLNLMLEEKNKAPLPASAIRQQVSNGARAMVELGFGLKEGEPGFKELWQQFLDMYYDRLAVDTQVFPGLNSLLEQLEAKQVPWGIVTNKPSRFTIPLLEQLALSERCAVAICPDDVTHRKPHPEPIYKACSAINADPSNTIYIGDHVRDIESGKNAGNVTIAVSWGYIPQDQDPLDWNADHTLDSPQALEKLVLSFC